MTGFGGMVSFLPKGDIHSSRRILKTTKLLVLAESLGGVESLISSPEAMAHAPIPARSRKKTGIRDDLTRLSVGIEETGALIEDLSNALGGSKSL